MLGRTLHEYIFVRICIAALQYPAAIYISALIACLLGGELAQPQAPWNIAAGSIVGLMLIELAYALFIWRPFQARLKEPARHPALASPDARQKLFDRCMATVPDPEQYLRMWFLGAKVSDIRRDNVRDFIRWAFFDRGSGGTPGEDCEFDDEVDQYIARIEQLLGRPFEPGRGSSNCLRLTFDDITTRYRSVWWYIIVTLVDAVTHVLLHLNGFQYYAQPKETTLTVFPPRMQQFFSKRRSSARDLSYWYRPHLRSEALPAVFFHGIGIGIWTYVRFLAEISGTTGSNQGLTGVIALELLPISFRLTKPPLSKHDFLLQLTGILDHHAWDKFVLVSHSYGSVLSTHAMKSPELQARIPRAVLIDPVSILLHLPEVAYNFTRRRPNRANEWQLSYFASTDPGVARCLGRYFFWRENIVWAEELVGRRAERQFENNTPRSAGDEPDGARQVTVCLSGQDLIVNTHAVARYLTEDTEADTPAGLQGEVTQDRCHVAGSPITGRTHHRAAGSGINVLWFPGVDHAQVFDSQGNRRRIVHVVQAYCKV